MLVAVGKFGDICASVGKGGKVWMGQTDRPWIGDISSGCTYMCRSMRYI